ncbi:MAG: hypothetical protein PHW45_03760 [Candidatus ainarchaeum sp.]|nr:hypothetical protein [Patescibacteria group bacterium]MDD2478060.1 hypothetical protein [Candidatus ainarchaeum sp.]MDD3084614.1 hypothetical protein [Candidatus ainarchaeum sp.]MDD4221097.1 hypothetical protein [Candidatus ainarchaeum sp.]MDD4662584.1 hypothetical protein [Candidatus ainarchaeum sp.]
MKILLLSRKENIKKLPNIKFNIKKHEVLLPTFQLGKTSKFLNENKEFIDKDIELIKRADAILVCNFDKGKQENYIGSSLLLFMGAAYALDKKIYLLYDFSKSKSKEEIKCLDVVALNGDLNKII